MSPYPQKYYENRDRVSKIYELAKTCDLEHLTDDLWGGMFSESERLVLIEIMLNGPMSTSQVKFEIGDYVPNIHVIVSNLTLAGLLKRDRTQWPWRYTFNAIAATAPTAPPKFENYSEIKRVCPKCDVVLIVKFGRFYCPKCMEIVEELQVKEVAWK